MKFRNIMLILVALLVLQVSKVLSSPNDRINTWSTGDTTYGITLTTEGVLVPNTNAGISLGGTILEGIYEFNGLRIDGTATIDVLVVDETLVVTGDISGSADIRATSFLGIGTPYTVIVVTATTIAVTGSNLQLISADNSGSITMTAQPVFSTGTANAGDYLLVTTTQTVATFVLDEGNSALECLQLSGTITIGKHDSLLLILESTGTNQTSTYWRQVSTSNN